MKISIITAVYNRAALLERTIESVAAQTYRPLEYLIIDGNSSDGTREVIRKHKNRIDVIVSEPDKGIYDAINKGLKLATGDIIGLLHSDDIYHNEDVLASIAEAFKNDEMLEAVFGDVAFVRDRNDVNYIRYFSSEKFHPDKFDKGFMPAHTSFFCRRDLFLKYGFYRTDMKIAADFELLVRMLYKHQAKYKYLPVCTTVMTMGGASTSGLKSVITINKEFLRALRVHSVKSNYVKLYSRYLSKWKEFIIKSTGHKS